MAINQNLPMKIKVMRAPADPICTRVSLGGSAQLGYYCTFRGSMEQSIAALRLALAEMENIKLSGQEVPVDRRYKELGAS